MTDQEFLICLEKMMSGDKDGLRSIYQAYVKLIYKIVYEIMGNKEDTEDVVSEFFIKLYKVGDRYQAGNGHKQWMVTIARNLALDTLRKKQHEYATEELPEEADTTSSVEEQVITDVSLKEALKHLDKEELQIIHMKFTGDMTFREISEVLCKPMGTITWKYNEAIKKIRRVYQ